MTNYDGRLSLIKDAAEDKKGKNIKILKMTDITTIADYFVILHGNNLIQTKAIADGIEEKMEKNGHFSMGKEGYREGNWILLDYGEIVVHVFHKEDREYYNLERLWGDCPEIQIDEI